MNAADTDDSTSEVTVAPLSTLVMVRDSTLESKVTDNGSDTTAAGNGSTGTASLAKTGSFITMLLLTMTALLLVGAELRHTSHRI